MKLSFKIMIPVMLLIVLVSGILVTIGQRAQQNLVQGEEREHLESLGQFFMERIKAREQTAVALATTIAEMPDVQAAFAAGDRDALANMLHQSYLAADEAYGIPQSQFHIPPATSFLRLHNLEKNGDDLSSFRNTVLAANQQLAPISGLEKGKGGRRRNEMV